MSVAVQPGQALPSTATLVPQDGLEPNVIVPILQIEKVKLTRLESLPQNEQVSNPKHVIRVAGT